ncbi:MAG: PTS sugar transporter subunit IIB [Clostridiaceae bacterium]|nr:PTS sugar transporter subunit IIB [Clostridiaceae bacterium]
MKYHILVACGTGGVTSTAVATRIKEGLAERGLNITTKQCRIQDVAVNIEGMDVVVTTSRLSETFEVPMFNGIAFLTGVGVEKSLDEIELALLNSKKKED